MQIQIDGKEVDVQKEMTVLTAARQAGIDIPTLCHHEKLAPFGGCRLCIVEAKRGNWTQLIVSCVYPAEEGLEIQTRSEKVDRVRKTLLELLMAHAPDSEQLMHLAKEYGADRYRFEKETSFCVHCGLCVRYCAEVKQKNAVGFIDRGVRKEISFDPQIASVECHDCKECFPLCPTSYLQAAFVLTESFAFPSIDSIITSKQ
ncbi:MAG: 2Fe-2S iron-sulfur cluster-binding protein [Desulfobacterales bacterium]|nr:2Fe-2S iron-sulfur cluster-binding protein [Desulfobacterales bacterium]